jgi:hypothetical protein
MLHDIADVAARAVSFAKTLAKLMDARVNALVWQVRNDEGRHDKSMPWGNLG